MSKTSVLAILLAAGISLAGPIGSDAQALAKAIQSGSPAAIEAFVANHPDSALVADAIVLAANQNGKGANGNNGKGVGGSGPGNQGNDKPVGNAGGYRG